MISSEARIIALFLVLLVMPAWAEEVCTGFGPQSPRDIEYGAGTNRSSFAMAPPSSEMNLCNIHTHTNAEHKGPGFRIFAGPGDHGGYKCNETANLTAAELSEPEHSGEGVFHGVKPGDTIEVHWVYSSCDVFPGPSLSSCLIKGACENPQLRVESQVFLVVSDADALDFADFTYRVAKRGARHQPRNLPSGTGTPIEYLGSTTGTSYDNDTCSPLQVTWSVRPKCAKLDIGSLHRWALNNPFYEDHSHGVRELVTDPALLSRFR